MAISIRMASGVGSPSPIGVSGENLGFVTHRPIVTFPAASGTYLLLGYVVIDLSGAVLTAARTMTISLRRTNHTPLTIAKSTITIKLPVNVGSGDMADIPVPIPPVPYALSGATGDVVAIRAHIDSLEGVAGDIVIREARLLAQTS